MTYRSPMNHKVLGISAIVFVAVIMGMSALAPAISSLATENTILPSAWANCHPGQEPTSGEDDQSGSDDEGQGDGDQQNTPCAGEDP